MRSGLSVCIGGSVNVGKSSLINVLAQRQLAIVSPHAGTTRDVLETALDIAGYPALISDTAGIRQSTDEVERIGIERAKRHFADADVRSVCHRFRRRCERRTRFTRLAQRRHCCAQQNRH
jgi:tRNA modification GTPase